jgi:hypothetical protein
LGGSVGRLRAVLDHRTGYSLGGMEGRLDEEKLAQIRAWADAMLTDERAELRASARGLLLLADEVERLWEANRTAFANDIGAALADRLGTDPSKAAQTD